MDILEELESKISENEKTISLLDAEINALALDEKVKRYISLQNDLKRITDENNRCKLKERIIRQNICEHKLVCFNSLYFKRLKYIPSFTCLNCGKEITGYLDDNQVCINEQYIYKTDIGVFSDKTKDIEINYRYSQLKEQGLSLEEIQDKLEEEFKNNISSDIKVKIRTNDFK